MIASVERLFTAPVQRDPLGVHRKAAETDGNATDLGQVLALLNDALAMQRKIRLELIELRLELNQDIRNLNLRVEDLIGQVGSLRHEVASYRAADARHRRGKKHPELPPPAKG